MGGWMDGRRNFFFLPLRILVGHLRIHLEDPGSPLG